VNFDNGAMPQCAPFNVHDVVQVVVLPPMQDLQTLTHWLICFASQSLYSLVIRFALPPRTDKAAPSAAYGAGLRKSSLLTGRSVTVLGY
jgi:hypothetical protein